MTDTAARIIQRAMRNYVAYKNRPTIKVTNLGQGMVNIQLAMKKPSMIFGPQAVSLDLNKLHEVMMTRIKIDQVSLVLNSNQGTPDLFRKYLQASGSEYGAIINGGFFALNGFYNLGIDAPIGLHRFAYNASAGVKKDIIKRDVDNTANFFLYTEGELSAPFEDYENKPEIDSQLDLKTQVPHTVKDQYGLFRITQNGRADLEKLSAFEHHADFTAYLADAKYLLSAGPCLVWNNELTFTEEKLTDDRYQFKKIREYFAAHPGSVPPGTFYHADQANPRSAIALTNKGELLMVTVKGEEEPARRDGMTLPQFGLLMKLLDSEKALNLDGGYSSCQGFFNEKTMLTPLFIKKSGRDQLVPCSIVAKAKGTTEPQLSLSLKRKSNVASDQVSPFSSVNKALKF